MLTLARRPPVTVLFAHLAFACATSSDPSEPVGGDPDGQVPVGGQDAGAGALDGGPDAASDLQSRWWRDDVFYEIFVRSFADSDGDGVGDLPGLTARLDVLNDGDASTDSDLGVTGIWLMPIHASPSYHGYDVVDYTSVNPDYGTQADLETFLAETERRGIRVVIDFVMNHSSVEHPWFRAARTDPDSEFRDYYSWRADDPGWTQPWSNNPVWHRTSTGYYYGLFWSGMPDLNLGHPPVEQAMTEAMAFWLERGMDGFRVDAARHFFESDDGVLVDQPESHAFMQRVRRTLDPDYPDALYIAEAWANKSAVAPYFGDDGDEFQLAFGFDTGGAILDSVRSGTRASFEQNLRAQATTYDDLGFEAPFLTNHDMPRVMRQLNGDQARMRVAAAALFAMPGTPFIYYGEEIGMRGGPSGRDEDKRTPMRWTEDTATHFGFSSASPWHQADEAAGVSVESQRGRPDSLWSLYRDLIRVRAAQPALSEPRAELPARTGGGRGGTALLRPSAAGQSVLFVANFDDAPSGPMTVADVTRFESLFDEGLESATQDGETLTVELAPFGFAYLAVE
jgi:glycosidase